MLFETENRYKQLKVKMELRNRNRMGNTQNNAAQTRGRSLAQPAQPQQIRPRNEEPQPVSTSQNSRREQERTPEPPSLPQPNKAKSQENRLSVEEIDEGIEKSRQLAEDLMLAGPSNSNSPLSVSSDEVIVTGEKLPEIDLTVSKSKKRKMDESVICLGSFDNEPQRKLNRQDTVFTISSDDENEDLLVTPASLNRQRQDAVNRNSAKKKKQRKSAPASEVIELDDGSDIEIQNSNQIKLAPVLARQEPPPKPVASAEPQISCPVCMESVGDLKKANRKILTTPCGHLFCDVCLKASLQAQQNKCPQCRKKVTFSKCIALFI